MRMGELSGRCSEDDAPSFIALLGRMRYAIDRLAPFAQFDMILPLAREHALTVYDAIYLHLAMISRAPLATFDKRLASAAREVGVEVLGD
jgi:predicted nucleic acid-binding protein